MNESRRKENAAGPFRILKEELGGVWGIAGESRRATGSRNQSAFQFPKWLSHTSSDRQWKKEERKEEGEGGEKEIRLWDGGDKGWE